MPYGSPAHHPFGVTNVFPTDPLGDYVAPDPSKVFTIFDDFFTYTAGAAWTETETVAAGTVALAAGDYGTLLLTTGATGANDNEFLQSIATMRTATATGNKKLWFKTRLQVDDATLAAFTCGLFVTAGSPIVTPPTDGIRFLKAAGATTLSFVITNGGVSTTIANVGTAANATPIELAFYYNTNTSQLFPYVNGARVGNPVLTNLPTSADALRASIGVQASTAVARTMLIDYVFAANEK